MKKLVLLILFATLFQVFYTTCVIGADGVIIANATEEYKSVTYPISQNNMDPMNFRKESVIGSDIIGLVDMFSVVLITGEEGDFYKADAMCTDGVKRTGFLSKLFVDTPKIKYSLPVTSDLDVYKLPSGGKKSFLLKSEILSLDIYYEADEYLFFISGDNYGFVSKQTITKKVSDIKDPKNMAEILNSSVVFAVDAPFAINKGARSKIDAPPFLLNDRGMIPIRYAAEVFDGVTGWNDESKCVDLSVEDKTIKIFTGKNEMLVNEMPVSLDVAPVIVNDRSFIPIRAFSEIMDKQAYFITDRKQIIISDYHMNDVLAAEFCDYVNKNYNLYSELRIESFKIPTMLPMGKSYNLSGKISSDRIINRVAFFIYDETEKQEIKIIADNNTNTFSITDIDKDIKFDTLTKGEKRIEIWAADETQSRLLFEMKFTVIDIKDKFLWPVPLSTGLSGCYGRDGLRWHPAIDITGENGTDVVASADGLVIDVFSGATDNFPKGEIQGSGYGNYVKLEHTNRVNGKTTVTKYNHLSKATVKVGDKLQVGDKLGELGSTGSSYGYHLDYQLFLNGDVTDPGPFIVIPADLKFTGTTVDCCLPYIENLKEMNKE